MPYSPVPCVHNPGTVRLPLPRPPAAHLVSQDERGKYMRIRRVIVFWCIDVKSVLALPEFLGSLGGDFLCAHLCSCVSVVYFLFVDVFASRKVH